MDFVNDEILIIRCVKDLVTCSWLIFSDGSVWTRPSCCQCSCHRSRTGLSLSLLRVIPSVLLWSFPGICSVAMAIITGGRYPDTHSALSRSKERESTDSSFSKVQLTTERRLLKAEVAADHKLTWDVYSLAAAAELTVLACNSCTSRV